MKALAIVLLVIVVPGGLVIALATWFHRRRRARFDGPSYVQHLAHWQASEPQIAPLALPPVKPLRAHRESLLDRFRPTVQRMGKR